MRYGCIYIIKNEINDLVYIGQTMLGIDKRWKDHIKASKRKTENKFYKAINTLGIENFHIETLEEDIPLGEIDDKERFYIQKYNSFERGYNSTKGGDGKNFSNLDEYEIISLYYVGLSATELGELYNTSNTTILRVLSSHGVELRSQSALSNSDVESFKDFYLKGVPLKTIAEKYNIDMKTVSRLRKRYNLPKRLHKKEVGVEIIIDEDIFIRDYLSGMKLEDIALKHGISVKTVGKKRNKLNLPKRKLK